MTKTLTLDPSDEFEATLMQLAEHHRVKRAQYGSEEDAMENFYLIAEMEACSPLQACDSLFAKHQAFLTMHKRRLQEDLDSDPKYVEDAYLDRAVYGILSLCLYRRELDADG